MPVTWRERGRPTRAQAQRATTAALTDVGRYVRARAAKYPGKADSASYRRTGTLGRSIAVSPVRVAPGGQSEVYVGTNLHYARHVEYGTGIYGRRGQRIRPKTARALAWRSTGRAMGPAAVLVASGWGRRRHQPKHDVYLNFARSVRGMRGWRFLGRAFEAPETERYMQRRLRQMVAELWA